MWQRLSQACVILVTSCRETTTILVVIGSGDGHDMSHGFRTTHIMSVTQHEQLTRMIAHLTLNLKT